MSTRSLGLVTLLLVAAWTGVASAQYTTNPSPIVATDAVGGGGTGAMGTLSEATTTPTVDLQLDAACTGFTVTPSDNVTLPEDITVTYTATARTAMNASCTVHIKAMNGMGSDLGTFTVQGQGIAPELSITTTPEPIDFGSRRAFDMAASPTATRAIRVENTGDDLPLTINTIDIAGTHSADFVRMSTTFPIVLMQGEFADIDVVFNPGGAGTRTATFDVDSDDPVNPTESADLTGIGTSATIRANDLDFNTVSVGTTTTSQIRIDNTAASNPGPLTITAATITQSSTWFSFDGANGCTAGTTTCTLSGVVANNATTMPALVNLRCHPPAGAMGFQVATVTFTSDTDAGGTDNTAGVTCTAGRADVTIDPTSFAFGDQLVNGTSTPKAFTIDNPGSTTLTYSLAFNGGDTGQFQFSGSPCTSSCTLNAGGSTTVSVVFAPTSTGAKTTNLRISSNDPDNPTVDVALTGNGVAPHAMPDKNTLAFGMVEVGDTSTAIELTVTNNGTAPLLIDSAGVVVNMADYTVPMGTLGAQTVGVGMSAKWMIACRPTTYGSRDGTFRIVSNSDGIANNPLNIALACSGNRGLLVASPTSLAFGTVPVGEMVERTFTLTNPGDQPVTNISATFSNPNAGYTIVDPPALPISMIAGNNGSVTIRVRFAPVDTTSGGNVTLTLTGAWGTNKTAVATVALSGTAQSVAFAVAPGTVDFGSFRWDTNVTRTVCVQNNAAAPFDITGITLANVVMPGDITIVSIKRTTSADCSVASASPNITTWPQTLTNGQRLEVIVRADPVTDRTGALSASLQVTSNLMGTPMRMAALSGTATSPALTLDPATAVIDFGLVDRDQPAPAPRELLLTNSGDGPLNLGTFTAATAGTPFTITATSPTLLLPGQSRTFTVTYDSANAPENVDHMITLTQQLSGILGGPTSTMVMIKARTIDRHIAIAGAPAFPMTFRNPGSLAPIAPVTVTNTGEATLKITAVMLMGAPVWEVVDGNPVDIAGGASHDFQVRFLPTDEGPAPQGQLVLMNDDNQQPMAVLNLYGIGRLRDVVLGDQPVIDLGETAVGLPITLPEGLPVINRDAENAFTIARIELADASAVQVENEPEGDVLDAAATLRYDLTFTPEAEGEFETTATLYLDEDPVPTTTVQVRGRAVFVDLGGGGGCSTGGGTGGAMVLVLGALLLVRRRRQMPALLAVCLLVPAAAHAQEARFDLDLSLFDPTPSTTGYRFQIEPATVGDNGDWVAAATASYAANPLVMRTGANEHLTITRITTLELGAAYAFLDRFEAGLRMPLYSQDGDGTMLGVPSPSGTARGDLVAHARAQLIKAQLGDGFVAAGASVAVTLPTATEAQFAGVDMPSGRVLGLVTLAPGVARKRLTFTGNLGAILRSKTQVANIEQGSGVAWGAGMSVRVLDKLWTTGEVYGDWLFGARRPAPMATAENMLTAEWLLGLSYRPDPRVAVGVALGRGLTTGLGAPELRGVFAVTYAPGTEKLAPIYPPPPPKVDGDEDADGLKDSKDKCPADAEDKDGFQDDDGCPDADNDSDTYTDSNDKCPLEAEDVDGFQDDDGCPDLDNDSDRIPDAKDRCPTKSEDRDSFLDDDGCPEVDNDEDGLLDEADKCPKEPETINGNDDDDGCPDRGDALIIMTPSALDMLETIQWNGSRLAPASKNLLSQVGATLRAHPEILRLKIVSHVNPTGNAKRDRELTEKRAIAIREWLITWGIVPTRLSGQGMGSRKPLVPSTQKGAAQLNDRIELIILEKK